MFLLTYIENISFSHLIMMISLIIFLIYFLIKVLLEILKKWLCNLYNRSGLCLV